MHMAFSSDLCCVISVLGMFLGPSLNDCCRNIYRKVTRLLIQTQDKHAHLLYIKKNVSEKSGKVVSQEKEMGGYRWKVDTEE